MLSRSLILGAAAAIPKVGSRGNGKENAEPEVTATEDLMREHGVLRRTLLVYREAASRLRGSPGRVDPAALADAASLFRRFGEEYHEKMLEEQHIFPVVRKRGGEAGRMADILVAQHQRGREITEFILSKMKRGTIGLDAPVIAGVLEAFDRVYENHAAREDTIVFPAWKLAYTNRQLDEKADEFEDIEKKMFGHDGFEDAEKRISRIEATLALTDLAQFTAPRPPAV